MTRKINHLERTAVVLMLALALGGCDSDNPTAPSVTPSRPPTQAPSASWAITVTANPSAISLQTLLELGNTAAITITVRRSDNGQAPPQGATVVLSASDGLLTAGSSSGTSIPVALDASGRAAATLTLPARAVSIVVQAQLEQNIGQTTVRVLESPAEDPLFIESVIPSTGPPSGGTEVRIQGSGFDPPVRVSFGGVFAEVLSVGSNVIRALTPAIDLPVGATSTVSVTVSINVNDPEDTPGADTLANAFTYARAGEVLSPSIISISPTSGPNEGGTQVTIFGENFADAVQVFFGTSALIEAPVISVSPTRLVVETPSATGPNAVNQNSIVGVRVVNVASGAFAQLASAFQYGAPGGGIFISTAGPTEGPYFGGTNVTIFGQGFDEPVAVEFGGFAQPIISVTGTEIIARSVPVEIVACADVSGPFSVVNIETNEVASSGIRFTYKPIEPLIGTISPSEVNIANGRVCGDARTTFSGVGFDFPVRVTFGGVLASVVEGSVVLDGGFDPRFGIATAFDVEPPPFRGQFNQTEVCSDDFGNVGTRPIAVVDVEVENVETECTDALTAAFTYRPVLDCATLEPLPCEVGGSPPEAIFSFSVDNLTVSFANNSTGDPAPTFLWSFGDGSASTEKDPQHAYAAAGTYTVTLTATNDFGSDETSAAVTVAEAPPVAAFTFQGVAGSDTISFLDQSTGNPTSWSWAFGDGATSTLRNPTHDYNVATPTIFTVTLTVSNAGGSDSTGQLVEVPVPGPPPTPVIAAFSFGGTSGGLVVNFIDESTGNPTSWSWDFGDGGFSSLQNPIRTYAAAGTYTVTLDVMNDDGSTDSASELVTVPLP